MAKKGTKKVEVIEEVNTHNIETAEEIQQSISEKIEAETQKEFDDIVNEIETSTEKTINEINDVIATFTETYKEEITQKDSFLSNFEEMVKTKTESEIKEEIQKEIDRVTNVIENKIPMTTNYWNGMNFDF